MPEPQQPATSPKGEEAAAAHVVPLGFSVGAMAAPVIRITLVSCLRYASTPLQLGSRELSRDGRATAARGTQLPDWRHSKQQLHDVNLDGQTLFSPLQGLRKRRCGGRQCGRDLLRSLHHFQPHIADAGGAMRHENC